jgi:hypothetical protein
VPELIDRVSRPRYQGFVCSFETCLSNWSVLAENYPQLSMQPPLVGRLPITGNQGLQEKRVVVGERAPLGSRGRRLFRCSDSDLTPRAHSTSRSRSRTLRNV